MTTILRSLLLAGAMAGLITAGGIAVAPAQDKKDTKTAKAGAGTIKINEGKDGKFRFNIYGADGKYLAGSPVAHDKKEDAAKAVDALKAALPGAKIEYGKSDDKKKDK